MKKTLATLAILTTLAYPANTTCEQGDNVTNFVKRFYDVILHREPDTEGLEYWEQKLASQTLSASELANGFIFSPEFTGQENDDVDYVNVLYRAFFDREPDTEGINGWIENLAGGMSREEVLHGFLYSQEFKNLADAYGIRASNTSGGGGTEDGSLPVIDNLPPVDPPSSNGDIDMSGAGGPTHL